MALSRKWSLLIGKSKLQGATIKPHKLPSITPHNWLSITPNTPFLGAPWTVHDGPQQQIFSIHLIEAIVFYKTTV